MRQDRDARDGRVMDGEAARLAIWRVRKHQTPLSDFRSQQDCNVMRRRRSTSDRIRYGAHISLLEIPICASILRRSYSINNSK
jgi:hypothetical protein